MVIINQDQWRVEEERKPGVKMLIKKPTANFDLKGAFFKYPLDAARLPVPSNEFICYCLGTMLGLPVAKVEFKELEGQLGILSYLFHLDPNHWSSYPYRNDITGTLRNADLLPTMIVFDCWINNNDRGGENLMFAAVSRREPRYEFHLIDNANTLLGPDINSTWPDHFNFDSHVPMEEFRSLFQRGIEYFADALSDVSSITDEKISYVLDLIPESYIDASRKTMILNLLISRRDRIYTEFSNKCNQVRGVVL